MPTIAAFDEEPLQADQEPVARLRRIYLDANATVAPLRDVSAAVLRAMRAAPGNPSSAHSGGSSARRLIESARDSITHLVPGSDPDAIVFVSGGTEANNWVIESFGRNTKARFIAAPVEHSSICEPLSSRYPDRVRWAIVDSEGRIDPDHVRRLLNDGSGPALLIVQAANSETGVVQPVAEIARVAREGRNDVFFHVDAAQAIGRVRLDLDEIKANTLSFSGHKLHGPGGTGVLVIAEGEERLTALLVGGGQERGLRSGTPNVPGIAGLGVAAQKRAETFAAANRHMCSLRDSFEHILLEGLGGGIAVNGGNAPRISNTSNIRFNGIDGMKLLAHLDAAGVMASQGSACSAGRPEPSRVLRSMGLSEEDAFASLRFSFSVLNTPGDAIEAAKIVVATARRLAR